MIETEIFKQRNLLE